MRGAGATRQSQLELSHVEASVGAQSFQRGRAYARRGRVLKLAWAPDGRSLSGAVVGNGALYRTTAFFDATRDDALEFADGECSCPVGFNCKHVAALVIDAAGGRIPTPAPVSLPDVVAPPAWEAPLRALIETREARSAGTPLAIELSLGSSNGAPRLMARLLRPGARGGWINGSLTWSGLEYLRGGEHRPDHVALMRELHAVTRARRGHAYYYSGADKTLDLSGCGPQLWSLLDEAAGSGWR